MKMFLILICLNFSLFAETQEDRVRAEENRTRKIRDDLQKKAIEHEDKTENSDFKWLQNKIINHARLVVESVEIVKILLKRDLKTEFNNLWEGCEIPKELQRIKKDAADKILFYDDGRILRSKYQPNIYECWHLDWVGTSREFLEQGSGLFYLKNRKDYPELILEKFERICGEYQKIIIENKVEQRRFLIDTESIELYKIANLISKNPREFLIKQPEPKQPEPKKIQKIIVLKNGNEIPILMSIETTSTLTIKTLDGKIQEIQKSEVLEIK